MFAVFTSLEDSWEYSSDNGGRTLVLLLVAVVMGATTALVPGPALALVPGDIRVKHSAGGVQRHQ